jgi:hypothetical protein
MLDLSAAVKAVVATLEDAGVPAAFDMRDLELPGVYVTAPTITWRFRKGDWNADWTAYATTNAAGRLESLDELAILVAAAQEALGDVMVTGTPADLSPLEGGDLLPAYRITWSTRLTEGT